MLHRYILWRGAGHDPVKPRESRAHMCPSASESISPHLTALPTLQVAASSSRRSSCCRCRNQVVATRCCHDRYKKASALLPPPLPMSCCGPWSAAGHRRSPTSDGPAWGGRMCSAACVERAASSCELRYRLERVPLCRIGQRVCASACQPPSPPPVSDFPSSCRRGKIRVTAPTGRGLGHERERERERMCVCVWVCVCARVLFADSFGRWAKYVPFCSFLSPN